MAQQNERSPESRLEELETALAGARRATLLFGAIALVALALAIFGVVAERRARRSITTDALEVKTVHLVGPGGSYVGRWDHDSLSLSNPNGREVHLGAKDDYATLRVHSHSGSELSVQAGPQGVRLTGKSEERTFTLASGGGHSELTLGSGGPPDDAALVRLGASPKSSGATFLRGRGSGVRLHSASTNTLLEVSHAAGSSTASLAVVATDRVKLRAKRGSEKVSLVPTAEGLKPEPADPAKETTPPNPLDARR